MDETDQQAYNRLRLTKPLKGKLTLVPESDKREAVRSNTAQEDFQEVSV